jgi:hypothetical protein
LRAVNQRFSWNESCESSPGIGYRRIETNFRCAHYFNTLGGLKPLLFVGSFAYLSPTPIFDGFYTRKWVVAQRHNG